MKDLRRRLSVAGVKPKFLNEVVLPSWWDDSIAKSPGGFREAAGIIAGHLGFSLRQLITEGVELGLPRQAGVKFKKAKGVSVADVCLSTQLAIGLARTVAVAKSGEPACVPKPENWRQDLLKASDRPWVCLRHLLSATWDLGIPLLRVNSLPQGAKKPDALTTMIDGRPVIVILSARKSPSWVAFYVAHELGHLHHGHLKTGETLVDEKIGKMAEEEEEIEANDYAVRLLTGQPNLGLHSTYRLTGKQLARQARIFGETYKVAPGVAALNYGFTTGAWAVASAAVSELEKDDHASEEIGQAMLANLDADDFSEDAWEWLNRVTGCHE